MRTAWTRGRSRVAGALPSTAPPSQNMLLSPRTHLLHPRASIFVFGLLLRLSTATVAADIRVVPPRVCLHRSSAMAATVAVLRRSASSRLSRLDIVAWSSWFCRALRLASPWPVTVGTPQSSAAVPPWPAMSKLRHTCTATT